MKNNSQSSSNITKVFDFDYFDFQYLDFDWALGDVVS